MITDFRLPPIDGEVSSATIAMWRKAPGENVEAGEVLLEVVTEKVNVEIECPIAGRLVETLVEVDTEVNVGALIARIDTL